MPSQFIPRDREIKALESHFSRGSRVGLVSGPVGIGKTALVRLSWDHDQR
jgi:type II secretory pathway predicted ATPase ExeA